MAVSLARSVLFLGLCAAMVACGNKGESDKAPARLDIEGNPCSQLMGKTAWLTFQDDCKHIAAKDPTKVTLTLLILADESLKNNGNVTKDTVTDAVKEANKTLDAFAIKLDWKYEAEWTRPDKPPAYLVSKGEKCKLKKLDPKPTLDAVMCWKDYCWEGVGSRRKDANIICFITPVDFTQEGAAPELHCDDFKAPGGLGFILLHPQHLDKLAHEVGHLLGCSHGASGKPTDHYPKDEAEFLRRAAEPLSKGTPPADGDPCPTLEGSETSKADSFITK